MRGVLVEVLEPLAIVADALLATSLAVVGATLEWVGVLGGSGPIGQFALWQSYMGLVALAAAATTIVRMELLATSG